MIWLKRIWWFVDAWRRYFSWKIKRAGHDMREKLDIIYTIFCVYFNHVCFGDDMPSKEYMEFLWDDLFS